MKTMIVIVIAGALAFLPAAAIASPQDDANAVSEEVMSPFCPGVTLHECPSSKATELRDEIAGWFADGMTRAEVFERLESEYGPGIRATPDPTGAGLAAWLLPAAAVVLGLGIAATILRRRKGTEPVAEVGGPDRERLETELSIARARR